MLLMACDISHTLTEELVQLSQSTAGSNCGLLLKKERERGERGRKQANGAHVVVHDSNWSGISVEEKSIREVWLTLLNESKA